MTVIAISRLAGYFLYYPLAKFKVTSRNRVFSNDITIDRFLAIRLDRVIRRFVSLNPGLRDGDEMESSFDFGGIPSEIVVWSGVMMLVAVEMFLAFCFMDWRFEGVLEEHQTSIMRVIRLYRVSRN